MAEIDALEGARLLRELAGELLERDGMARNGTFLELHRLHDVIFRAALERHPEAPPGLAARAFAVNEALPAAQVPRELAALGDPLGDPELCRLFQHVTAARNRLVHRPVIARQQVSRQNSRRMAHLARLTADVLDPDGHAISSDSYDAEPHQIPWPLLAALAALAVGIVLGAGAALLLF